MIREWKPGDVGLATVPNGSVHLVLRLRSGVWVCGDSTSTDWPCVPESLRPLVVIDPEDGEQVERLRATLESWSDRVPYDDMRKPSDLTHLTAAQEALRSLVTPPKPEEPTGLGAVVEDDRGDVFVMVEPLGNVWRNARTAESYTWGAVAAVKVLSQGWSE